MKNFSPTLKKVSLFSFLFIALYYLIYIVFGCDRGLDFTDESMYLSEITTNNLNQSWIIPFGWFLKYLSKSCFYNIAVIRTTSILILLITNFYLFKTLYIYLSGNKLNKENIFNILFISTLSSLFFYKLYIRIPGYNYLSYLSLLISCITIIKISTLNLKYKKDIFFYFLLIIAYDISLLMFVTSKLINVIYSFIFILYFVFYKQNLKSLIIFIVSIICTLPLLILLANHYNIFSVNSIISVYDKLLFNKNGLLIDAHGHSIFFSTLQVLKIPYYYIIFLLELSPLTLIIQLITFFFGFFYINKNLKKPELTIMIVNVITFFNILFSKIPTKDFEYSNLADNRLPAYLISILPFYFFVLIKNKLYKNNYLLLFLILIIFPVFPCFGTNNGIFNTIGMYISPAIFATLYISTQHQYFKLFNPTKIFIFIFLIITIYNGYQNPYRGVSLSNQIYPIKINAKLSEIKIDKQSLDDIINFKLFMQKLGYKHNNIFINLTDWNLQYNLILDSHFPNSTIITAFDYEETIKIGIHNLESFDTENNFPKWILYDPRNKLSTYIFDYWILKKKYKIKNKTSYGKYNLVKI